VNSNKLNLNPTKTDFLIISPKLRTKLLQLPLSLNKTLLSNYNRVKYLGVFLDSQLNFQAHIKIVEQNISKSIGIISKLKNCLPPSDLLKIYYALVHPHLLYDLTVWGSTRPTYLKKFAFFKIKLSELLAVVVIVII